MSNHFRVRWHSIFRFHSETYISKNSIDVDFHGRHAFTSLCLHLCSVNHGFRVRYGNFGSKIPHLLWDGRNVQTQPLFSLTQYESIGFKDSAVCSLFHRKKLLKSTCFIILKNSFLPFCFLAVFFFANPSPALSPSYYIMPLSALSPPREWHAQCQPYAAGGGGVAQLCGAGRGAQPGLHHRLLHH